MITPCKGIIIYLNPVEQVNNLNCVDCYGAINFNCSYFKRLQ